MNGKTILSKLKENGFSVLRVSGSQHILSNGKVKVSVPIHGATDVKFGTLKEALIYLSHRRKPVSSVLIFLDSGFRWNDVHGFNQRFLKSIERRSGVKLR